MIEFHLDPHSGVAPYLQIVQQVKGALRLDMLKVGDQLPTVREVVAALVINPNTVLKAYRDLEHEGLVVSRPGQGTFVVRTLAGASLESHAALRRALLRWLLSAHEAGLDNESILALFTAAFHEFQAEKEETA
jgi:DNA-binding transcriptional regulator YhcF (GntR family)